MHMCRAGIMDLYSAFGSEDRGAWNKRFHYL